MNELSYSTGGCLEGMRRHARWLLLAICTVVCCVFVFPVAAAEADDAGPHQLLITYRSEARDRPAFRNYLAKEGRAPFDRLLKEGALKEYQILFNPYNGAGTWDAMVVMNFNRFADTRKWRDIERVSPGGLSAKGLKLARPVDTYSADLTWQASTPGASSRDSVFYVIPYEYNSAGEYKKYVDAYVIPQVQGWMREGVLSGYRMYMNRFPVGRPWDALFIYQYKDADSFGNREKALQKVREGLKTDPVWQKFNEIKQTLRSETENTITEIVEAR
jgi:hypothetical protein